MSDILLQVEPGVRDLLPSALRRRLKRRAHRMLRALGFAHAELSILFAGDATLAELNQSYRQTNGPTDVLSFSQYDPEAPKLPGQGAMLGDLAISLELVRRRSPSAAAFQKDLVTLLAHGILHLLGLDHATQIEERQMFGIQAELVRVANARGPVASVSIADFFAEQR